MAGTATRSQRNKEADEVPKKSRLLSTTTSLAIPAGKGVKDQFDSKRQGTAAGMIYVQGHYTCRLQLWLLALS